MNNELNNLHEQLELIEREANCKKNNLMHAYAMKNKKYQLGDILKGRVRTIKVDSIRWSSSTYGDKEPFAVYYGKELTKKLIERKDGSTGSVYGDDVIKENK